MLVGALALIAGGCSTLLYRQHQSATALEDVICSSFQPILIAKSDTKETKRQAVIHNDVWDMICLDGEEE